MEGKEMGTCKHGRFALVDGCQQCINENLAAQLKVKLEAEQSGTSIVKVRYFTEDGEVLSAREYTYFSEEPLQVGQIITVPVRDTIAKAKVSQIDVHETEIEAFKDKVKTIPKVEETVGVPNRSVPNETEAVIRVDSGACLAPTDTAPADEPKTGTDVEVWGYYKEALKLQHYAESRVIATVEDTKSATDDLSVIAKLKKAMEEKRKEYVVPLQTQVKQINDTYKSLMEPIESADRVTRSKILDYRKAQERIRQEQEEVNRLRMEAARREMELKGELTESVDLVEVVPEVSKSVTTDMGAASTFKVRKWEIVDFTLVPNDLKLIDAGKVTKLVKAGIGSISGIRIWEEDSLRVTPR